MKRHCIVALSLVFLITASVLNAQTMNIHSGNEVYHVDLLSIDSLTFTPNSLPPVELIHLEIDNQGYDGGGNLWLIEAAAWVYTEDGLAPNGTLVRFDVSNEAATIEHEAYTGNLSIEGHSWVGVAFATISYPSNSTNTPIDVTAEVFGGSGESCADTVEGFILPIQDPAISMDTDIDYFVYLRTEDHAVFATDIFVTDGHDQLINNQLVRYLSNRGQFHVTSSPGSEVNPDMLTGNTGECPDVGDGQARRFLIIPFNEAFPNPNVESTTVEITGYIIAHPDISSNLSLLLIQALQ